MTVVHADRAIAKKFFARTRMLFASQILTAPVDVFIKSVWEHQQPLFGLLPYTVQPSWIGQHSAFGASCAKTSACATPAWLRKSEASRVGLCSTVARPPGSSRPTARGLSGRCYASFSIMSACSSNDRQTSAPALLGCLWRFYSWQRSSRHG